MGSDCPCVGLDDDEDDDPDLMGRCFEVFELMGDLNRLVASESEGLKWWLSNYIRDSFPSCKFMPLLVVNSSSSSSSCSSRVINHLLTQIRTHCMAPDDSLFLLFDVHFDGTFLFSPLRYENGIVYEWAVRKDNPLDLATVHATLREKTQSVVLYELFFKLPQCELDVGLKIIENDRDLDVLYEYAHDHGVIQVYITHGPRDLSSYYVENMCLYRSEDGVNSRRKSVPKDAGNMSVQELVSRAEDEAALGSLAEEETVMGSIAIDDDICVTGVVDKGKWLADKGKGLVDKGKGLVDKGKGIIEYEGKAGRNIARTKNSGIVIGENVNPTFSEDDDTDSERDMEQRFKATVDLEEVFKEVLMILLLQDVAAFPTGTYFSTLSSGIRRVLPVLMLLVLFLILVSLSLDS
ncbi:hypothetical protein Tco_0520044 [Tanacetum coccineum]